MKFNIFLNTKISMDMLGYLKTNFDVVAGQLKGSYVLDCLEVRIPSLFCVEEGKGYFGVNF